MAPTLELPLPSSPAAVAGGRGPLAGDEGLTAQDGLAATDIDVAAPAPLEAGTELLSPGDGDPALAITITGSLAPATVPIAFTSSISPVAAAGPAPSAPAGAAPLAASAIPPVSPQGPPADAEDLIAQAAGRSGHVIADRGGRAVAGPNDRLLPSRTPGATQDEVDGPRPPARVAGPPEGGSVRGGLLEEMAPVTVPSSPGGDGGTTAPPGVDPSGRAAEAWEALNARVTVLDGTRRTIQVALEPEGLGPMKLQVKLARDGARAVFEVSDRRLGDLLASREADLRQTLEGWGVQLGAVDVRMGGRESGQARPEIPAPPVEKRPEPPPTLRSPAESATGQSLLDCRV
ncbi:MAG: flagellar hook-length control protein FliK [bacterium]|nr:flagellar hook-length control protein FliK [bacterium]